MQYLCWRVLAGLHEEVEMNFLIAGHTKFSCDLCFGLVKKRYRRTRVSSLEDIVNVSAWYHCILMNEWGSGATTDGATTDDTFITSHDKSLEMHTFMLCLLIIVCDM